MTNDPFYFNVGDYTMYDALRETPPGARLFVTSRNGDDIGVWATKGYVLPGEALRYRISRWQLIPEDTLHSPGTRVSAI